MANESRMQKWLDIVDRDIDVADVYRRSIP